MSKIKVPYIASGVLTIALVAHPSLVGANESDVVTKLPAPIEDVALADSGQTLVLKLKGQKGLAIYNAKAQKLATIDLVTSDFTFGAGGDTAVVFLKESNELRSYSLKTLTPIKSKEFTEPVLVRHIIMGHCRNDMAFIVYAWNTDVSAEINQLLDVTSLRILGTGSIRHSPYCTPGREYGHFRADGRLERITEWKDRVSPSGIGMFVRTVDGYQHRYNHDTAGFLVAGNDGLIYSGYGIIYRVLAEEERQPIADFGQVGKVKDMSLLPGQDGQVFLGIDHRGNQYVYQSGQTTPLCSIAEFPDWSLSKLARNGQWDTIRPDFSIPPAKVEESIQSPLTLDKRIVFAPASGYILFLPPSNDRIVRRNFDLKDALERTGHDYLVIVSNPPPRSSTGTQWDYQITPLAKHEPVKFLLEKSPEGMLISPEGRLTWRIPDGIQGKAEVVVAITDSRSNLTRHAFTLWYQ